MTQNVVYICEYFMRAWGMYILLFHDEVIFRCQLNQGDGGIIEFNYILTVCLLDLSISDKEVLNSPKIILDLSISPCSSITLRQSTSSTSRKQQQKNRVDFILIMSIFTLNININIKQQIKDRDNQGRSIHVWLKYFNFLLPGSCISKIGMSSWRIYLFVVM